jgi:hypothetical protein
VSAGGICRREKQCERLEAKGNCVSECPNRTYQAQYGVCEACGQFCESCNNSY